ncbi:MAG: single-stranded DNA-binding protein [Metamycoplasmataceae bacterium]
MNKIILVGRLASDPQVFDSKNLTKYTRCRIAVTRDNNKDESDFIPLVAFSNTSTFINTYFSKGDLVLVEGSLSASNYKNDKGAIVESISVVVQNIKSLEPRSVTSQRKLNKGQTSNDDFEKTAIYENKNNNNNQKASFSEEIEEEKDDSPWELDL